MAEVNLRFPFAGIRGALGKDSPYYYKQRNGKTFLCCKPGATEAMRSGRKPYKAPQKPPSAAQLRLRERFTLLQKAASEICSCPTLRAHFEQLYRRDKKAKVSLQAYVMKQIKGYDTTNK